MDHFPRTEADVSVETIKESFSQVQHRELSDLQLTLVGGGMGDTIL